MQLPVSTTHKPHNTPTTPKPLQPNQIHYFLRGKLPYPEEKYKCLRLEIKLLKRFFCLKDTVNEEDVTKGMFIISNSINYVVFL